jgi:hypothetical protein
MPTPISLCVLCLCVLPQLTALAAWQMSADAARAIFTAWIGLLQSQHVVLQEQVARAVSRNCMTRILEGTRGAL